MSDINNLPTARKRDAAATKDAILDAARMVFMNKGYDSAGTREIADRAGVNVALISRYFGSKEGLFKAAIPPTMSMEPMLIDDMAKFGAHIAKHFVHKDLVCRFDPMLALIRAAASENATQILCTTIEEQFITPLANRLKGSDAYERATLIGAQLTGYDLATRVIGVNTSPSGDKSKVEAILAKVIQDLVDG
tara:strand:- start:2267 stop:2842 length:576 start_codon:yes stop_codon:yes gene_type:complete